MLRMKKVINPIIFIYKCDLNVFFFPTDPISFDPSTSVPGHPLRGEYIPDPMDPMGFQARAGIQKSRYFSAKRRHLFCAPRCSGMRRVYLFLLGTPAVIYGIRVGIFT